MSKLAGLIFDCDGTLADTMPLHYVAWQRTMAEYEIPFPEDRFYALGGQPTEAIVALLAGEHGKTVDVAQAAALKDQRFLEALPQVQAVDWVAAIARKSFGSLPMAVGSGSSRTTVLQTLRRLDLLHLFPCVVAAEDTARHKPEPDVFLRAAEQMGVLPAHCLVYEDADLGIEAARRAGMQCIDVRLPDAKRRAFAVAQRANQDTNKPETTPSANRPTGQVD